MTRTVVVATLILIICVGLIVMGMIWASKAKVSATRDHDATAITVSQADKGLQIRTILRSEE
jgi:hypothetical protein